MKTIKAKLGMSRAGMGENSYMRMEIEDETSGVRFLELEIPMEGFAYLVSGLHGVSATATLRGTEYVGMQQVNKREDIALPKDLGQNEHEHPDMVAALLAPYEVDGWVAYKPDLFNYHRSVSGKKDVQSVGFHRYVEVDDNAKD